MRFAVYLSAMLLAFLAVGSAGANEHYKEKAFNADTREKFQEIAANVRKEMEPGGRYQYVEPKERKTIDQKLSEMESLFQANASVGDMRQDTKIKMFNAQEVVNSILTHRDRDRVICKSQAPIGSHIPVTSCHTYGQEVEARHATHNQMDEWTRGACSGDICAMGKK